MMNSITSTRARLPAQQHLYLRRQAALEALDAGTATEEHLNILPSTMFHAWSLGGRILLRPDGHVVIISRNRDRQLTGDVEMTDASPVSSRLLEHSQLELRSRRPNDLVCTCTARVCRRNRSPEAARIPHMSYRMRYHENTRHQSRTRILAFQKIPQLCNSKYGNSTSPLAEECTSESVMTAKTGNEEDVGVRIEQT
jgi:hypothetical protein